MTVAFRQNTIKLQSFTSWDVFKIHYLLFIATIKRNLEVLVYGE